MRRVGDCGSRSQGSGDHRDLGHLGIGCTCLARVAAVDIDAIRALSRERNGDCDPLLVLYRNCSSGDSRLVKCPKAFITSDARVYIFFRPARFSLLYICVIVLSEI